jgi:hypothetical protein
MESKLKSKRNTVGLALEDDVTRQRSQKDNAVGRGCGLVDVGGCFSLSGVCFRFLIWN